MNPELNNKFESFLDMLRTITPSHKHEEIEKIEDIINNKYKMMLFLLLVSEDNKNKNIWDFIKKFNIENTTENYNKIEKYYSYFIQVKKIINKTI